MLEDPYSAIIKILETDITGHTRKGLSIYDLTLHACLPVGRGHEGGTKDTKMENEVH